MYFYNHYVFLMDYNIILYNRAVVTLRVLNIDGESVISYTGGLQMHQKSSGLPLHF